MALMLSTKRFDCDARTADEAKRQTIMGSRILANEGIVDGLGHVSVRNPENPNTFFQTCSVSPEFACLDDVMEIDLEGTVVQGIEGKKPFGERILHARVLASRPDMHCVFHGHPSPLIPFSLCPEIPLKPAFNYGSLYYNGLAYYDASDVSSGMIVLTPEEGDRVARALGDKWACLMRGHGVTVCAENVAQLVYDAILLVKAAEVYLECLKTGENSIICSEEEGRVYRNIMHGDNVLVRIWDYYVARAKKAMPDIADVI